MVSSRLTHRERHTTHAEIQDALNAIAANEVKAVNETSTPSYATIKELKEAGYVTALDSSADDGWSFMKIEITFHGRQYLERLNASA